MLNRQSVLCAAVVAAPTLAMAQEQLWVRDFGSPQIEFAPALAPDGAGGVFIGGWTYGDLARPVQAGDAWIARYDSAGDRLWIDQFGSDKTDETIAAAPDGAGGVFIGGLTRGSFGGEHAGRDDAWVAHHDGEELRWVRQLGTSEHDRLFAVAPDGAGGVFAAGETYGDLAGSAGGPPDIWVARYDGEGSQLWLRQFGTAGADRATALLADGAGGFFMAGSTNGSFAAEGAGRLDVWVGQFDADGEEMWIRQFGSSESDEATGVATDGAGGVLVAGWTWGALAAPVVSLDHFIARHNAAGEVWFASTATRGPTM